MQHLKDHLLSYVLVPLLILAAGASYYRFMVLHDHMVSYEGFCDPATESCFVGCEEEVDDIADCPTDLVFYYTEVERHATELYTHCGDSIIDCPEADYCTEDELDSCVVIYCDPLEDVGLCDGEELAPDASEVRYPIN